MMVTIVRFFAKKVTERGPKSRPWEFNPYEYGFYVSCKKLSHELSNKPCLSINGKFHEMAQYSWDVSFVMMRVQESSFLENGFP